MILFRPKERNSYAIYCLHSGLRVGKITRSQGIMHNSMNPDELAYTGCCSSTVEEFLSDSLLPTMERVYEYYYIWEKIDRINFI
jgi:hypothetical protein